MYRGHCTKDYEQILKLKTENSTTAEPRAKYFYAKLVKLVKYDTSRIKVKSIWIRYDEINYD